MPNRDLPRRQRLPWFTVLMGTVERWEWWGWRGREKTFSSRQAAILQEFKHSGSVSSRRSSQICNQCCCWTSSASNWVHQPYTAVQRSLQLNSWCCRASQTKWKLAYVPDGVGLIQNLLQKQFLYLRRNLHILVASDKFLSRFHLYFRACKLIKLRMCDGTNQHLPTYNSAMDRYVFIIVLHMLFLFHPVTGISF